ncbi:MAG: CotH kinase family protein [Clostridia bacterium]|nr:CotH kinase family protein [Clostridia bacterium]
MKKKIAIISVGIVAVALLIYGVVISLIHFVPWAPKEMTADEFYEKLDGEIQIPIIEINTQNGKEPEKKGEKIACEVKLSNSQGYDFSVGMDALTTINVRGNSTAVASKKPYELEFNVDTSLLGLKAEKEWILLADYYDQSVIRNYTALTLASYFDNMDFNPTPNHVTLFVNDEFKGIYLLTEKVNEEKGRCDVDTEIVPNQIDYPFLVVCDTGFIEEKEALWNENCFKIYYSGKDIGFEIKYPSVKDLQDTGDTAEAQAYVKEYIEASYNSIKYGKAQEVSFSDTPLGFEDLVDVESVIDYYLINEIMLNRDSCRRSIFMYKEEGGKLKFGPVWDFDYCLTTEPWDLPYTESEIESAQKIEIATYSYFYREFFKYDKYYEMTKARFEEKKGAILEVADHLRDYKSRIKNVAIIDAEQWHGDSGEFEFGMQYDYVRLFLYDRYEFLVEAFKKPRTEFLEL